MKRNLGSPFEVQSSPTCVGCGTAIVSICLAALLNRTASIQSVRSVEIIASDLGTYCKTLAGYDYFF